MMDDNKEIRMLDRLETISRQVALLHEELTELINYKQDKKSVRYFTCEMTQKEFEEFTHQGKTQPVKHKFNMINKEWIKNNYETM